MQASLFRKGFPHKPKQLTTQNPHMGNFDFALGNENLEIELEYQMYVITGIVTSFTACAILDSPVAK